METFSALLAVCAGNSPVTCEFPAQRPVTRSFDFFLICAWICSWVNNREAGDFRRHRAHCDVTVMVLAIFMELFHFIHAHAFPRWQINKLHTYVLTHVCFTLNIFLSHDIAFVMAHRPFVKKIPRASFGLFFIQFQTRNDRLYTFCVPGYSLRSTRFRHKASIMGNIFLFTVRLGN